VTEKLDLPRRVGRRIARIRALGGMTQEGLAAKLEIALKNLQRIEGGQNLTLLSLERIARALGVEVIELFATAIAAPETSGRMSAAAAFTGLVEVGATMFAADSADRPASAVPITPPCSASAARATP
jgi:transcriptional regulator with XRE-family HTH domain